MTKRIRVYSESRRTTTIDVEPDDTAFTLFDKLPKPIRKSLRKYDGSVLHIINALAHAYTVEAVCRQLEKNSAIVHKKAYEGLKGPNVK